MENCFDTTKWSKTLLINFVTKLIEYNKRFAVYRTCLILTDDEDIPLAKELLVKLLQHNINGVVV